ncbi:hypothetical protein ACVWY3_005279 [Bradyrhizobium sp. USDA 4486]
MAGGDAVCKLPESRVLVAAQRPGLVAADEHLEHDAAVGIDEGDEGRGLAHERTLDEGDARATLVAEMAV